MYIIVLTYIATTFPPINLARLLTRIIHPHLFPSNFEIEQKLESRLEINTLEPLSESAWAEINKYVKEYIEFPPSRSTTSCPPPSFSELF